MDIASGIAAVTQGIGIAKAIRNIEKSYDEATLKAKIAEVIDTLLDAKMALADAKEGMAEKDKEIERLKAAFEQRGTLYVGPGDYKFFTDSEGLPSGYPICPSCEARDGRIVQLKEDQFFIQAKCPVCSAVFRPVECFVPQAGGGPTTKLKLDDQQRSADNARTTATLREAGRNLA